MKCPRLDHFVRLQPDGKFGKCGNMTGAKEFANINDMQNSEWLKELKEQMYKDCWPKE